MSANIESIFYVRETPWHGLGVKVEEAVSSGEALWLSGLDWRVVQKDIYAEDKKINGYKANIRDSDGKVLGVVSDRYRIVQNDEAFAFTDALLGEGVRYETAGSLSEGRQIWMLARLPEKYIINGDEIAPYLVFSNSHDGSGAVRVAITPIRVVCQNTLNLALNAAKRCWGIKHTGDINSKLHEAKYTLLRTEKYMNELGKSINELIKIKLSDKKVLEFIDEFFPVTNDMSDIQVRNNRRLHNELEARYFDAPDLQHVGKNAYRFINAVSDMASHGKPTRATKNYKENLFKKTIEGNAMIDKAYQMVLAA